METIKLTIDNKEIEVPKGTTIYKAARESGIDIPTLCYMELHDMNIENKPAGCRICVAEVSGRRTLAPTCSTKCEPGMVVKTHTPRVLNARRTVMEFILSNHPKDCLVCSKSGTCELQDMAHRLGIKDIPGAEYAAVSTFRMDTSPSIIRNLDKCIMCRRCEMMCNDVQTVGAISAVNRGFMATVAPAFEQNLEHSTCTYCGQCVSVCPTGALTEVNHVPQVLRALVDPTKTVVVQTAPAVRAALGEEFGLAPGTLVTGKMTAALRALGFDYVFDTDFAADLTIMEEGTELLDRLSRHLKGDSTAKIPILTSCCPGWVNFFEEYFPDRKDMVVVSIMPCLAKKYECQREEFSVNGNPDVDFSISTRELASFIKQANIDIKNLHDEEFDSPLGESTGAGVIFGTTGGVIEAACRTAYELYTGKKLERLEFTQLRGMEGVRSATIDFNSLPLNIGIAHGLGNARKLLDDVRSGKSQFHAIEVMACPGGCIGGGGQPLLHGNSEILMSRAAALYTEDRKKPLRKSHENPFIIKLYNEFLGKPGSEKAHHLLHTHYFDKKKKIMIKK